MKRSSWLLLTGLAVSIILLRIPSFFEPHWYGDEEIYLTIGQALRHGYRLYQTIIDNKPPLFYAYTTIWPSLGFFKASLAGFAVLDVWLLWYLGKKMKLSRLGQAIMMVVATLLLSLPSFEGTTFNAELMFLPLTIAGIILGWNRRYFLAGVCFSLASLIKIPAAADLAAVGLWLLFFQPESWRQKAIHMARLGIGFIVPWLMTIVWFYLQGSLGQLWHYAVSYNFGYLKNWTAVSQSPLLTMVAPLWLRLGIGGGLSILIIWLYRKQLVSSAFGFGLLWMIWSFEGALLGLRPYPHYFLQVLPALSLLVALTVTQKRWFSRSLGWLMMALFVWFLIAVPVDRYRTAAYYRQWFSYITGAISWPKYAAWFDGAIQDDTGLVEELKQAAGPNDRLFVWGNAPTLYAQSKLLPATPYVTDYLIQSHQSIPQVITALTKQPPELVVDCHRDSTTFPDFYQLLQHRYRLYWSNQSCAILRMVQ